MMGRRVDERADYSIHLYHDVKYITEPTVGCFNSKLDRRGYLRLFLYRNGLFSWMLIQLKMKTARKFLFIYRKFQCRKYKFLYSIGSSNYS